MRRRRDVNEDGCDGLILTILLLASLVLLVVSFPPKAEAQFIGPNDVPVAPIIEAQPPVDENGLPTGHYGYRHSEFHAFYEPLFNNQLRMSCCHARDCRPTQSRVRGDHYELMINGTWMAVEKQHIINAAAPDGGAHICTGTATSMDPVGRIYCAILPPEG